MTTTGKDEKKPVFEKGDGDILECPNCHAPEVIGEAWKKIKENEANLRALGERFADIDKRLSTTETIRDEVTKMHEEVNTGLTAILDRVTPREKVHDATDEGEPTEYEVEEE